ncbi:hypothetical protein DP23_4320 [Ralstonia pickettii]|nr:hypothetical protein DP23_4320 [Ralstonia pickettii]
MAEKLNENLIAHLGFDDREQAPDDSSRDGQSAASRQFTFNRPCGDYRSYVEGA